MTTQTSHVKKSRKLAIEAIQSIVKKPTRSQSISIAVQSQNGEVSRPPTPMQGSNESNSGDVLVAQNAPPSGTSIPIPSLASQGGAMLDEGDTLNMPKAEEIFDTVRNQYFEALYHSMVRVKLISTLSILT
jgi:DNA replication regulator SLD3